MENKIKITKTANTAEHIKWLKEKISDFYGDRCKDECEDCYLCQAWKFYDEIEEDEEAVQRENNARRSR